MSRIKNERNKTVKKLHLQQQYARFQKFRRSDKRVETKMNSSHKLHMHNYLFDLLGKKCIQ